MVRSIFFLISLSFAASLQAQSDADKIPDPKAWAAGLPDATWTETPGIVRTFTIIQLSKKPSKKWTRVTEKMSDLGFLQYIPVDAAAFAGKLNVMDDAEEKPLEIDLENPGAQLILKEEKGRLVPQHVNHGKLKQFGKWGIAKADYANSEAFYQWLIKKMSYDAVVLDVKDGFILAGLLQKKVELGQGLLIKNSSERQVLSATKIKGDALLQMLRIEGDYAVFESLLSNSKAPIKPGTKILLGQSEKLKGMMAPGRPKKEKSPAGAKPTEEESKAEPAEAEPAASEPEAAESP